MTYRSILVHVDGTDRSDARMRVAARLAQVYPAQIVGVYLVPGPQVSPFATALIPPDFVERRLQLANDAQHAAEAKFREAMQDAGVKQVEFRAPVGDATEALIAHSRYADLIVLGQPPRDEAEYHYSMELANAVLMGSGRPVLFVPYTGADGPIGERVLIAWKDARESARAVADALPFLKEAKKVLAVAIADSEEETLKDLVTDKQVEFRAPVGDATEAVIAHSRYADLIVLGQPPRDEAEYHYSMDLANAVLMGSGRPVLFVPYTGADGPIGERVLIAWKDARESARAVADALPFLKEAKKVLAVAIADSEEETLKDLVTDKQVEGFLRRHEIEAQVKRIVAPDIDAGELLLSHVADIGADLVVMGGYSRPRFTQLVWGGVSKLILNSMTVPVLMSH